MRGYRNENTGRKIQLYSFDARHNRTVSGTRETNHGNVFTPQTYMDCFDPEPPLGNRISAIANCLIVLSCIPYGLLFMSLFLFGNHQTGNLCNGKAAERLSASFYCKKIYGNWVYLYVFDVLCVQKWTLQRVGMYGSTSCEKKTDRKKKHKEKWMIIIMIIIIKIRCQ